MKKMLLLAILLLGQAIAPGSEGAPQGATSTVERVAMKRAIEVALDAVKERLGQWENGCTIRARPSKSDWAVQFEPEPMGPGLDVLVVVHHDGSRTIYPGF